MGLNGVEVNVPQKESYPELDAMVRRAGMKITSFSCPGTRLDNPGHVTRVEEIIAGAAEIGTPVIFLSSRVDKGKPEDGIPVLRKLAEKAHRAGVTVSLETHPPYGTNGDTARKTLDAVGAPGIGYNFDTANIYYYNERGIDTVQELKKVLKFISSVHLKESAAGEPKSEDFPILGTGIVNFPEVFRPLGETGFTGPYTLELEGPLVDGLPVEQRTEKIAACVDYLKKIGAMG
jgi:sugar phosphate isomerase/epimerase